MGTPLSALPARGQLPSFDAEKKRIRDLSRYYSAIRQPSTSPNATPSPQLDGDRKRTPSLSQDIILTALVQLGVYRFGCNRAFVSLIDGQNQHIISEATASISLRDSKKHLPNDGIYLGVTTLDLVFGVCPHAMKLFTGQHVPQLQNTANVTANPTRFIVRDFTLENNFKDKPYVVGWPFFRFYAEVPVYSPAGYVLGSFCVVDDKPRQNFSDADVVALQEISDSISRHLENVRMVHYHARSDRLVQGLTDFVKGHPDDEPSSNVQQSISPLTRLPNLSKKSSLDDLHPNMMEYLSLSSTVTDETSPLVSRQDSSNFTASTSISSPLHMTAISQPSIDDFTKDRTTKPSVNRKQSVVGTTAAGATSVAVKEDVPISRRIEAIFSHACTLLKASMDLDDVLFLDACHCNSGIGPSLESTDWEPFPTTVDTDNASNSPPNTKDALCKVLSSPLPKFGHATTQDDTTIYSITESFLQHLITKYPRGKVFDLDGILPSSPDEPVDADHEATSHIRARAFWGSPESHKSDPSDVAETAARLLSYFPEAKSVIFLPLWDWNKGQWLAGTLIWSRDSERPLELEEFNYFKVFGDTIISEVARVTTFEQEKSKSGFISSVSHELRSPLHGMLASAELLLGTPLQPEQHDLVKMLETCGLTLLDTMNHLLDFTKINNLTKADSENDSHHSTANLVGTFDLGVLLEEVVNALYLEKHAASVSRNIASSPTEAMQLGDKSNGNLSVVLRITEQDAWKLQSVSGAWRRIIMNIFGNALKHTEAGFIEVSLRKLRKESQGTSEVAHLSIVDTGHGMSADFLRNKLFSPFAQEDSLSEGVGLGMSIVQQLVGLMKGTIDVKSERDIGTQVDVFIPIHPAPNASLLSLSQTPVPDGAKLIKFCLIGFNGYSELTEVPTGSLSREAKRRLCIQSLFAHVITHRSGWSVSFAETFSSARGDVAIVEEETLDKMIREKPSRSIDTFGFNRLIVLGDIMPSSAVLDLKNRGEIVSIHPPFYPRKILEALNWTLEANETTKQPVHDSLRVPRNQTAIDAQISESPTPVHERLTPLVTEGSPVSKFRNVSKQNNNLHVLIVDDNEINLKVLSAYIRKLGHTYETATNGLIALNKYKESPRSFGLVLMVLDGIAATRKIRAFERQQEFRPVTVLAVTGVASATMQQQALSAGVDNYLIKPLSLQQLKQVIANTA
ncbi:hypothetical protein UA08_06433 [Talaromyces atroroseus]|uniref:histidine kinase n=1 Tax=Talaromyces atroroseus TaxID=1441469 RepID=A0A225ALK4_TALAT|nr:hypothetical protein UA08_06433 [Talaromyces atroroseus]OKL58128.1 hypothetical protein UA08_06433 [Talaromyces atroroseus]